MGARDESPPRTGMFGRGARAVVEVDQEAWNANCDGFVRDIEKPAAFESSASTI